ncbi:MAG TPA: flagellar hook-length control protein FliK [Nitrococcus sp.]|nr:flagellar hook-length control protein FliK [Nitrococcus sp.]
MTSWPSARAGAGTTDEEVVEMMPCNPLQLNGPSAVDRAAAVDGGGTPIDTGFLTGLAAQLEKEAGVKVDPQTLAAWLKEHADDYSAIAPEGLLPLLAQLMNSAVAMSSAAQAASAEPAKNPAALLDLLVAVSGGSGRSGGEAAGQTAPMLLAALHADGHDGQLPQGQTDTGAVAPAVFQQLLQSAAAAGPGAPALPATEGRADFLPLQVALPVTQPGFGPALGERLLWMVQHDVQHARLQLDPPGLGPLDITVSLHADQISVALNAHHALTREVLAADAPRLRGLLADAGFGAVDVNVAHDQGRGDHPPPGTASHGFIALDASAAAEPIERVPGAGLLRGGNALVDHYA